MHKDACDPGIEPNEHMQVRLIELCRRCEASWAGTEEFRGKLRASLPVYTAVGHPSPPSFIPYLPTTLKRSCG